MHTRFVDLPPVGASGIEANAGIALRLEDDRLLAQPLYVRGDPLQVYPAFVLPRVPARLVEDSARFLRRVTS